MRIDHKPVQMGGILDDIGGGFMDAARGFIDLGKRARGDTSDVIVEGAAPTNYTNLAVYGTLAAIALVLVIRK